MLLRRLRRWTLHYFDKVYCVHYPDPQYDRRRWIEQQCESVGIEDVTYVHAMRPRFYLTNGKGQHNMRRNPQIELAVSYSHIKAIVRAISDGAMRPLFIEDDIEFDGGFADRLKLASEALPNDWDVMYLGGHPCGPVKLVSNNLAKVGSFSFAESYMIRAKALRSFYDFWLDRIGQKQAMYDRILGEFADEHESYCVYPIVTRQPNGYSHISKKNDDKSNLLLRGWQTNLT